MSSDCTAEESCYRGFCIIDPEADPGRIPETPGGEMRPDEQADAAVATTDASERVEPVDAAIDDTPSGSGGEARQDAGRAPDAETPVGERPADGGAPAPDDAMTPASGPGACTRESLKQRADAYLAAMASGDVASLQAHRAVRYTENGQVQQLGQGVWAGRPKSVFARHALDESTCSSATQAVLQELLGRTVFGVRLRYVEEQLLEVEAQVVVRNGAYFAPDDVIQSGDDPWIAPVPPGMRMSRDALRKIAANYFASTQNAMLLPAHAASCIRRQNGKPMDNQGSCSAIPGNQPFAEQRYPVIDETAGIVTAVVLYSRYVGMYLFKVQDGLVQNIEVVGGAGTRTTGW